MKPDSILTRHLHEAGEGYFQHMAFALKIGVRLVFGGLGTIIHAVFPFLCVCTGSNTIFGLHDEVMARRKACEERRARTGRNP